MNRRIGLGIAGVLLIAVGLFYAFNAYIQVRERGFSEPFDIPIAILSLAIGVLALVTSRRA